MNKLYGLSHKGICKCRNFLLLPDWWSHVFTAVIINLTTVWMGGSSNLGPSKKMGSVGLWVDGWVGGLVGGWVGWWMGGLVGGLKFFLQALLLILGPSKRKVTFKTNRWMRHHPQIRYVSPICVCCKNPTLVPCTTPVPTALVVFPTMLTCVQSILIFSNFNHLIVNQSFQLQ